MAQTTSNSGKEKKKKSKWFRYLLDFFIIVMLIIAFRSWQQRDMVSDVAPNIQGMLMDGTLVDLKQYRGKPVLLHFWATWCPFCKLEEGSITSINKDWQVLTIAYQSEDKANIEKHLKKQGLESWSVISDPEGRIATLYGISSVPSSFIIDANGNIRFTEVGITSGWGLRARLWYADKFPNPEVKKVSDNPVKQVVVPAQ
ncbi:MAG: protein disulfide oxidoreductase [Cocleimonas sp.]|nr:protein disulfide oxidoreductase [Cocleimonas sp.]